MDRWIDRQIIQFSGHMILQTVYSIQTITPSLRHCSNKYMLAREGEKDKEKNEDFEKSERLLYIFFFFF